jgi:hypothetical protein
VLVPRVVAAIEILESAHARHDLETRKGPERPNAGGQQAPSQALDLPLQATAESVVQLADAPCPCLVFGTGVDRKVVMSCCLQHGRSLSLWCAPRQAPSSPLFQSGDESILARSFLETGCVGATKKAPVWNTAPFDRRVRCAGSTPPALMNCFTPTLYSVLFSYVFANKKNADGNQGPYDKIPFSCRRSDKLKHAKNITVGIAVWIWLGPIHRPTSFLAVLLGKGRAPLRRRRLAQSLQVFCQIVRHDDPFHRRNLAESRAPKNKPAALG